MMGRRKRESVAGQRRHRHAWRWVVLGVAVCVLPALLVIRLTAPDFAEPYAQFTVHDGTLAAFSSGFITRANPREFTFHDWTGKKQWSVDLGMPIPIVGTIGGGRSDRVFETSVWNEKYGLSISPDGHCFALLSPYRGQFLLQVWRDGRRIVRHAASEMPSYASHVRNPSNICIRVTDSKKVIVWFDSFGARDFDPFYIYQDGRCIARGGSEGYCTWIVSPDGETVWRMSGGSRDWPHIYRVLSRAGNVEFQQLLAYGPEVMNDDGFLAGERYLDEECNLFTRAGVRKISKAGYRLCAHDPNRVTVLTESDTRYLAVLLSSGQSWGVTVPGRTDAFQAYIGGMRGLFGIEGRSPSGYRRQSLKHVTSDGRFILAAYSKPNRAGGLIDHFVNYPHLYRSYAAVFEAPGKRRCLFLADRWFTSRISPDGHTVVAISDLYSNPTNGQYECQLYQW